eukprot:scaffold3964_cov336-Prasinococcus_capsulatus_cf.AAC.3
MPTAIPVWVMGRVGATSSHSPHQHYQMMFGVPCGSPCRPHSQRRSKEAAARETARDPSSLRRRPAGCRSADSCKSTRRETCGYPGACGTALRSNSDRSKRICDAYLDTTWPAALFPG